MVRLYLELFLLVKLLDFKFSILNKCTIDVSTRF